MAITGRGIKSCGYKNKIEGRTVSIQAMTVEVVVKIVRPGSLELEREARRGFRRRVMNI